MNSMAWIFSAEAVGIVTVNIVAIVLFTRNPRLRCRKYFLIVNLAVADLCVGLVSVPMSTALTNGESTTNSKTFATIYKVQDPFFATASLFGLAAVAIERVYATYYPFKHRSLSTLTYKIGISVVWACAFLSSQIFLLEIVLLKSPYIWNDLSTVATIFVIGVPITITMVSYFLIWVKMYFKTNIPHHAMQHSNARLTVTVAIVTLASLITWMPFLVAIVLWNKELLSAFKAFKLLHYGNSMVNFAIYVVRMRDFKAEILRRMRCGDCQNERVQTENLPLATRRQNEQALDTRI